MKLILKREMILVDMIITGSVCAALSLAFAFFMARITNIRAEKMNTEEMPEGKFLPYRFSAFTVSGLVFAFAASFAVGVLVIKNGVAYTAAAKLLLGYIAALGAAVIDAKLKIIPNFIPFGLIIARLGFFAFEFLTKDENAAGLMINSLVSLVLCAVMLLAANKISKGGIGLGDVKLISCIGFMCGLDVVLSVTLLSLIVCVAASLVLAALKKISFKDDMPFGPFIYFGYLIFGILLGI